MDRVEELGSLHVLIEDGGEFGVDEGEEVGLLHDAASEDDAFGGEGEDEVGDGEGEVAGFEFPGRVVGGEVGSVVAPAASHGSAGGEAFEAVAVEGADASEGIRGDVVRNADVAHFGVDEAVEEFTVDDGTTSDAGADGEVDAVGETAGGSPASLGESGGVNVGVETDGDIEGPGESSGEVSELPASFGGGGDMAPGGRCGVEIDGAETANAEGFERAGGGKEFEATGYGFSGSGGGDDGGGEVVGAGACSADELGATGFDCSELFHGVWL